MYVGMVVVEPLCTTDMIGCDTDISSQSVVLTELNFIYCEAGFACKTSVYQQVLVSVVLLGDKAQM